MFGWFKKKKELELSLEELQRRKMDIRTARGHKKLIKYNKEIKKIDKFLNKYPNGYYETKTKYVADNFRSRRYCVEDMRVLDSCGTHCVDGWEISIPVIDKIEPRAVWGDKDARIEA
jgi:hypothetical protein